MDMKERIARALDPEAWRERGDIPPDSDLGRRISGRQQMAYRSADAVLAVMREPDEGMVEAGHTFLAGDPEAGSDTVAGLFQIDYARNPFPPAGFIVPDNSGTAK